ncbi:formylglycine-generating enzyme required for sulfatase activity [Neolewinella xylanilytica]|uniref:Formylglycine-generating enzyme required for sulfatase activity n=1 Tax=Neolewinella xylanilytica TaxID=1514080 RepID=A0A2S6I6F1_9BACT|nr:SUMF1/EgtB/PvdO family nonheme iron enzyme [Neolewinella xylanilytica]PPK87093.1 formylglycine-generating enzyme required for sulfatase activity [Neolewinella xylanilytica]
MDRIIYPLLLCLFWGTVYANNIQVSNVALTEQSSGNGTTKIQFDLSWENSWRISVGPANHDAAWIFAKFRVNNGDWRHCSLPNFGHKVPAGAVMDIYDRMGAMIYRAADGSGQVDWDDFQLRWDYRLDGVSDADIVDVQVFAIEMVYVPSGAFYLGSVSGDRDTLNNEFFRVGFLSQPFPVTGEGAISVGPSLNSLYYPSDPVSGIGGDQSGPIPAAFPKGFAAFYCMKYEVSQDQWTAFFNTLSDAAKTTNDITGTNGKNSDNVLGRNGISWTGTGNATTSLPNLPLNYVNNVRMMAYLDWAGLRMMTELEYEKACRGPGTPVAGEFAWGTAGIATETYTLANEGTANEVVANPAEGTGNVVYFSTASSIGPLRVGSIAASAVNQSREESGGSYYGIMDLSGNVYERAVTVGNAPGRDYRGTHGDGMLAPTGVHNVANWPSADMGIGYRGGSHANLTPFLRVADRADAATVLNGANSRLGFRGVRTAQ